MHIGWQDWVSEIDMRRLALAEITLLVIYTYTTADLRATVQAIARGAIGGLEWLDLRPLEAGAQEFDDPPPHNASSGFCNGVVFILALNKMRSGTILEN